MVGVGEGGVGRAYTGRKRSKFCTDLVDGGDEVREYLYCKWYKWCKYSTNLVDLAGGYGIPRA